MLNFLDVEREGNWSIVSQYGNTGLDYLNPWVSDAANYVNTVAPVTNASVGSVVFEIKRLSKEYASDFDACYDAVGPPSLLTTEDRVQTLRKVTRQLRDSRRHHAKQCDTLLGIIDGPGPSAEEKLRNVADTLRRSHAQLNNSQRASEEDAAGMSIKGMDGIFTRWFLKKGFGDRTELLESLIKVNFEKQSEANQRAKQEEGGFIAACIQGAKNLKDAGIKNLIHGVAAAAQTNIEYVKAHTAMQDFIDNWTHNAGAKGPSGFRHNETSLQFAESVKHNSNKTTKGMVGDNLGGPSLRTVQSRLAKSRRALSNAGIDEHTLLHIAKHHRNEVWSVGIDETKLKTVSQGNEGESDYGSEYGKFGYDERQAYLAKRLKQASTIAADGSDGAILEGLREMEERLKADQKVIRCDSPPSHCCQNPRSHHKYPGHHTMVTMHGRS